MNNDIDNNEIYIYHNTEKRYMTKDISVTFVYPEDMDNDDIIENIHEVIRIAGENKKFDAYVLDILEIWKDYEEI
tara:strand:+ start:1681 stop:1905 length:225 start_codon:yes stop_codon:yes gene_type:complete